MTSTMPPGGGSAATVSDAPRRSQPAPDRRRRRVQPLPSPTTGRVSPSSAAIARPMLALLPVVTFLLPAIFVSFARTPTYTAEARMLVGGFDVESQAVPGFVEAARTLAETYSRLVETELIVEPVAEALGLDPSEVAGHISATSVPESSIIRVEGSASNSEAAIAFAQAAAIALEDYTGGRGAGTDDAALDEYEQAVLELRSAEAEEQRLSAATGAGAADVQAQAAAASERARLRVDSLRAQYAGTGSGRSSQVQLIGQATDTGSDRQSTLMLAVGASVILGLIAGMALVTAVVNREVAASREAGARGRS